MAEEILSKKSCGLKGPTGFLQNKRPGILVSYSSDPYASINSMYAPS